MEQYIEQNWETDEFCDNYEKTWEISLDEVHYGWLATGENDLHLLKELKPGSTVLDIGCGAGQNLIALAKKNIRGFGLDISSCMLNKAASNIEISNTSEMITICQGDMRQTLGFESVTFDAILSSYSMEYLSGVQELRSVIDCVFKRLKPNGIFILCFSHHSQATRYPELLNSSVPIGAGKFKTYNYSYGDAMNAFVKAGFSIERVIEQSTENPSKISYDEGKKFPYHFRVNNNPCKNNLDEFSNSNPHTVIYKLRKPNNPLYDIPRQKVLSLGIKYLWGYKRKIIKYVDVNYLGIGFKALFLAPRDNIIGTLDVTSYSVSAEDASTEKNICINSNDENNSVSVKGNSVLGVLHNRLKALDLEARYSFYSLENEDGIVEYRIFIESVIGLEKEITKVFNTNKVGLLVFVNGNEPAQGELPIDAVSVNTGDHIQLTYIAYTDNVRNIKNSDDKQRELF